MTKLEKCNIKFINVSDFLSEICPCCFVCGNKNYNEFFINGYIYRVCGKCLK